MRYIDADKLIDFIDCGHLRPPTELAFSDLDVIEMIKKQPTADVRENVRGEWIFPYGDKKYKRCSVCGRVFYSIPYNTNFCPSCGADMRG